MDLKEIKKIEKLVDIVSHSKVDLLEIKWGEFEVRISRKNEIANVVSVPTVEKSGVLLQQPIETTGVVPAPEEKKEDLAEPEPEEERYAHLHLIKSSIVGTFYEAPSPGAEPFVQEGDVVRKGQVLCIIEAMKVMNEIEADAPGRMVKIFVENGHPVEYGERLFAIEPL